MKYKNLIAFILVFYMIWAWCYNLVLLNESNTIGSVLLRLISFVFPPVSMISVWI